MIKGSPKLISLIGKGGFAVLLLLLFAVVASRDAGAATDPIVSVDAAPDSSNTATTVGTIDTCAGIPSGAAFDIDVVIQSVDGLTGIEASLLYDPLVVNVTGVNYEFLLSTSGASVLDVGDTVPDSDGDFGIGAVTFPLSPVTGSGVIVRLTLTAVADGQSLLDLSNVKLSDSVGNPIQPADSNGVYQGPVNDAGVVIGGGCSDTDLDGYDDEAEAGTPLCNGVNDDWFEDDIIDDGCPGGPALEGAFSEAQFNLGTDPNIRCAEGFDDGPSPGWPSDFVSGSTPDSTDRITIVDMGSFVAPVRRLNTDPGAAEFDKRWDLVPGPGALGSWINIQDLGALVAGETGFPPMFEGDRAINGPYCTD